jgi:hypothetical protein
VVIPRTTDSKNCGCWREKRSCPASIESDGCPPQKAFGKENNIADAKSQKHEKRR